MKRFLFSLLAVALVGCAGDQVREGDTEQVDEAAAALQDGCYVCRQACSGGGVLFGYGTTADGAYQDLSGCGSGGGTIECGASLGCPWIY